MPRWKPSSNSENAQEAIADQTPDEFADEDAAAKVTLVKPRLKEMMAEMEEKDTAPEAAKEESAKKGKTTRPKVGGGHSVARGSAPKKEDKAAQSATPETPAPETKTEETAAIAEAETAQTNYEQIEQLQEELAQVELAHDWDGRERTRQWDVKFFLLLLALFIAVNAGLALMTSHKSKNAPTPASAKTNAFPGPSLAAPKPPALPEKAATPAPDNTATSAPAEPGKPAPETSDAKPAPANEPKADLDAVLPPVKLIPIRPVLEPNGTAAPVEPVTVTDKPPELLSLSTPATPAKTAAPESTATLPQPPTPPAPAEPVSAQPTPAPAQPEATVPAQPATTAPALPEAAASTKPEAAVPAQPDATAPALPEATAIAKPEMAPEGKVPAPVASTSTAPATAKSEPGIEKLAPVQSNLLSIIDKE